MRRWVVLSVVAFTATIGWMAVRDARRGYHSTEGAKVSHFTLHSRLLHRELGEILVTPRGGGRGRFLLVWLHGRSAPPSSSLSDSFFEALRSLGQRAPARTAISECAPTSKNMRLNMPSFTKAKN